MFPEYKSKRRKKATEEQHVNGRGGGGGGPKKGRVKRQRDNDSDDDKDLVLGTPKPMKGSSTTDGSERSDVSVVEVSDTSPEVAQVVKPKPKEEKSDVERTDGAHTHAHAHAHGDHDHEEEEGESEGYVSDGDDGQRTAEKIVEECEKISRELMGELKLWREEDRGSAEANKGCIDLTSMTQQDEHEQQQDDAEERTKRVSVDVLRAVCPDVTLKPYQVVGVNWLYLLHQLNVNGVLADEMGLGKTVQTIVFLGLINHMEPETHTHLIVVPASVLSNWEQELSRFAPWLHVVKYHGSAKERAELRAEFEERLRQGDHVDVVLATYTLFERETGSEDRTFLRRIGIEYLVLDEGHSVKNASSQRYKKLKASRSARRLVLSGTPVQNNVQELLGLLSFLMPHIFDFDKLGGPLGFWSHLRGQGEEAEGIKKMRRMFSPFVLRRSKADVLDQLTAKRSVVERVEMTKTQKRVYELITTKHLKKIAKKREQAESQWSEGIKLAPDVSVERGRRLRSAEAVTSSLDTTHMSASARKTLEKENKNVFTEWRKAANHPLLLRLRFNSKALDQIAAHLHQTGFFGFQATLPMVRKEVENLSDFDLNAICQDNRSRLGSLCLPQDVLFDSAKFQRLRTLLPDLIKEGHRVLVFSQWTKILDLLEVLLDVMSISFLRLDGQTPIPERQAKIDSFNAEGSPFSVFLLSTRAGGLGINLCSADTVIMHDLDWNPEVDRQAEDRCHRIGQTKPVTVNKMVTQSTVDEEISKVAATKKERTEALLDMDHHDSGEGDEEGASISSIVMSELNRYLQQQQASGSSKDRDSEASDGDESDSASSA